MELIKCEKCGEYYSDTYRKCPFCQEEAAIRRGKPIHRRSKDFQNRRGGQAMGVMALLMVLIVAGAGTYFFFGDNLAAMLGIREPVSSDIGDTSQIDTTLPPEDTGSSVQNPDDTQTDTPPVDGGNTDTGNDSGAVEPSVDPPPVQRPETPVVLSSQDFTLAKAGEKHTLTVAGGGGTYTWTTKNSNVANVSPDGTVTAVGGGNTEVTVTDGYTTATCIVRVSGPAYVPPASGSDSGSSSGTLKLNREDMTLSVGESFQLKVSGTSSTITWSIADSSVATISGNGTVKCISKGTTTATAKVDGQTLKCIVRGK